MSGREPPGSLAKVTSSAAMVGGSERNMVTLPSDKRTSGGTLSDGFDLCAHAIDIDKQRHRQPGQGRQQHKDQQSNEGVTPERPEPMATAAMSRRLHGESGSRAFGNLSLRRCRVTHAAAAVAAAR